VKTNKKFDIKLPEIGGLYKRKEGDGFIAYVRFSEWPDRAFVNAFPMKKEQHWENWNNFIEISHAEQYNFAEWPNPSLLLVDIQQSLFHPISDHGVSPYFMSAPGIWMKFIWEETFLWTWFREKQAIYGKPYYDWNRVLQRID